jgi:glutathione S-transferase
VCPLPYLTPLNRAPASGRDGRTLAESNAILAYLPDGSPYLASNSFERAKVQQWLHFEQECADP